MVQMTAGWLRRLGSDDGGASAVEYAVLLALIIAVIFATIQVLGIKVGNIFDDFRKSFNP